MNSFLENLNFDHIVSENALSAWLALALGILGSLAAGWLAAWALRRLAQYWEARGRTVRPKIIAGLIGPVCLALFTLGLSIGLANLRLGRQGDLLPLLAGEIVTFLGIVAVFWYLYNLIGVVDLIAGRFRGGDGLLNRQMGIFASRLLRILVIVIAVLVVARSVLNWNITAWVAGLGIAGLAVSLAAQDLLKNFFGSLAILMDRSVHIDDHIIACGYDGTVKDIGLRSTKLRTDTGHEVTIPNANLMNNLIENLSRCPATRRVVTLLIAGKTPNEKLRQALAAVGGIFEEEDIRRPVHPFVDGAERLPEVRFEDFQPGGFKLTIAYWYAPATDPEYAAHAERVNLRIVEELQRAGVELAQGL